MGSSWFLGSLHTTSSLAACFHHTHSQQILHFHHHHTQFTSIFHCSLPIASPHHHITTTSSSFKCLPLHAKQQPSHNGDDPLVEKRGAGKKREFSLPTTLEECVNQACFACSQAIKDGKVRLRLELPLPLIGATDLDDWPGGIQQQFKAAVPMVNLLLKDLTERDPTTENAFQKYVIDKGDAVGVWQNDEIALVLFPTADSLPKVEALSEVQGRTLILFNAQWQTGQVVSDFGFGSKKKANEQFVESFPIIYYLKQYNIQGQNVRLLKCYPGDWQVFIIDAQGENTCAAVTTLRPSYNELEVIAKKEIGSKIGNNWFARLFQ